MPMTVKDYLDLIQTGTALYGAYQASQGVDVPTPEDAIGLGITAWDNKGADIARVSQEQQAMEQNLRNQAIGGDLNTLGLYGQQLSNVNRLANPELYGAADRMANMTADPLSRLGGLQGTAVGSNAPTSYNAAQSNVNTSYNPSLSNAPTSYAASQTNVNTNYNPTLSSVGTGYTAQASNAPTSYTAQQINQDFTYDPTSIGTDRGYDAARAGSNLSQEMSAMALDQLRQGDNLSDRQLRDINERARAGYNDRGRVRDSAAVVREIMDQEDAKRDRRLEARQFAGQAAAAEQPYNLSNQSATNQASQFGAQAGLQSDLANQASANQAGQFNAGQQYNRASTNASMANQAGALGLQAGLQQGLSNAQMANQASQFGAGQALQQDVTNAGIANQAGQFGIQAGLNQAQNNASLQQQANQYGLQAGLQQSMYNADAGNQAAQFGIQGNLNQSLSNAGMANQAAQYGVGAGLQQSMANQNAQNAMTNQNLNLANQRDMYNSGLQQQDFMNQQQLAQLGYNAYAGLQQDPMGYISGRSVSGAISPQDTMNISNSLLNAGMQNQANIAGFWGNMAAGALGGLGTGG